MWLRHGQQDICLLALQGLSPDAHRPQTTHTVPPIGAAHQQQDFAGQGRETSWQSQLLDWTYTKPWEPTVVSHAGQHHAGEHHTGKHYATQHHALQPCNAQVAACPDDGLARHTLSRVRDDSLGNGCNSTQQAGADQHASAAGRASHAGRTFSRRSASARLQPSLQPSCASVSSPNAAQTAPAAVEPVQMPASAASATHNAPADAQPSSSGARQPPPYNDAHTAADSNMCCQSTNSGAGIRGLQGGASSSMQQRGWTPDSVHSAGTGHSRNADNAALHRSHISTEGDLDRDSMLRETQPELSRQSGTQGTVYATPESVMMPLDLPSPLQDETSSEGLFAPPSSGIDA